jgi:hypothetical protein
MASLVPFLARTGHRICAVLLALLLSVCSITSVHAQEATEFEIKAVYILNFARFIQWPPSAFVSQDTPITIGVVGNSPIYNALEQVIQGETVNGRPLQLKKLQADDAASGCQIVFIDPAAAAKVVQKVGNKPVLTVSEADNFLQSGGMIHFVTVGETIRFEIDAARAEQARLQISSRLLNLSKPANGKEKK